MKYSISRAGSLSKSKSPCNRAYRGGFDKYDNPIWAIDINSIEEIQSLIAEVGKIVMGGDWILIYDDYIE
jgi:hypothetical protein